MPGCTCIPLLPGSVHLPLCRMSSDSEAGSELHLVAEPAENPKKNRKIKKERRGSGLWEEDDPTQTCKTVLGRHGGDGQPNVVPSSHQMSLQRWLGSADPAESGKAVKVPISLAFSPFDLFP